MKIGLDNKVAIVTGAARGIGLACAELLAVSGAKAALVDLDADNLAKAVKKVKEKGIAQGYQLDITNIPAVAPVISRIRQEMGEVDILVCSAGMNIPQPAHEVTETNWDTIFAVNTKGLFFCNQTVAIQSMIPRSTGAIVNIASQFGIVAAHGRPVYCASKGAVIQLTRAEAIDWAQYNIRVNAVAPTFVLTNLTRGILKDPQFKEYVLDNILFHRLATVDDVATAVCFLASDEASMITGTTLSVDGGWTAH